MINNTDMDENQDNKVNYKGLSVDFVDIMVKLHKISETNIRNHNVKIYNTMFDSKLHGVVRGGQFGVFILSVENQDGIVLDKKTALDTFQRYFQMFLGGDITKLVKSENIFPIVELVQKQPTEKTDAQKPVNETPFLSRAHRIISESVDYIFEEDQQQIIERKDIGYWTPYSFTVTENDQLTFSESLKNNLAGMFDGMFTSNTNIRLVDGSNETLTVSQAIQQFNQPSTFTSSKSLLMTNLHNSAVDKAAKVLGIRINDENINQFIINSGMTDDNRTISNRTDRLNADVRFQNKENEIGIVIEQAVEDSRIGLDATKNEIDKKEQMYNKSMDDVKKQVVEALGEYVRWFSGVDKSSYDISSNAVEFIPDYNAGKVQVKDGKILGITKYEYDKQLDKQGNAGRKTIRIGYKIGYTITTKE